MILIQCFIEPIALLGEGEYNINDLKEIKVTDSFLGLDKSIMACQTGESLHNCTTKHYQKTIFDQCGCMPLNMQNRHAKKVTL